MIAAAIALAIGGIYVAVTAAMQLNSKL